MTVSEKEACRTHSLASCSTSARARCNLHKYSAFESSFVIPRCTAGNEVTMCGIAAGRSSKETSPGRIITSVWIGLHGEALLNDVQRLLPGVLRSGILQACVWSVSTRLGSGIIFQGVGRTYWPLGSHEGDHLGDNWRR